MLIKNENQNICDTGGQRVNPYDAEICLYKPLRSKGCSILNHLKHLSQLFPLIPMLWVYGPYIFLIFAVRRFRRQNLTSQVMLIHFSNDFR